MPEVVRKFRSAHGASNENVGATHLPVIIAARALADNPLGSR